MFCKSFYGLFLQKAGSIDQGRERERLKSTNLDLHLQQGCRNACSLARGLLLFKCAYGQHFVVLSIVNPIYLFHTELDSLLLYVLVTEWLSKVWIILKDSEICVCSTFLRIIWTKINSHELIFSVFGILDISVSFHKSFAMINRWSKY